MKVFATDLDGTLVHNKKVTETDREAIAAFQKENLFGVCTGRPLSCLYDVEGIPFDFYIMCTGALLLDKDRHVIEEHLLDKELVRDIYIIIIETTLTLLYRQKVNLISILLILLIFLLLL